MKCCTQCEKENPSSARRKFIVETRCFVSPYSVSVWRLCNFVAKQRCDKSRPYTNLCRVQYKSILKACFRPAWNFRSLPKACFRPAWSFRHMQKACFRPARDFRHVQKACFRPAWDFRHVPECTPRKT
jgi:hypothetical protein